MKLIILAAGSGKRLYPLTKNTPKPLLDLGNGVTILERQIDLVKKAEGIKEILLSIGYRASQIEAKIKYHQDQGVKIRTIFNPFYEVSNNLMSLWMTKHEMLDSDFLITNGDNIFHEDVLKDISSINKNGIFLTVTKKDDYDDDDMKVTLDEDGLVSRVSKKIPLENTHANSIGLVLVKGEKQRKAFVDSMEELARDSEYIDKFWLEIFNRLSEKGYPVNIFETDEDKWHEIDFHVDVKNVKDVLTGALKLMPKKEIENKKMVTS